MLHRAEVSLQDWLLLGFFRPRCFRLFLLWLHNLTDFDVLRKSAEHHTRHVGVVARIVTLRLSYLKLFRCRREVQIIAELFIDEALLE